MDELLEKLQADFPKEAHSVDSSRGFNLTSIKAQYIKERLNEVFGIFSWAFEENFVEIKTGILCHGELVVRQKDESRLIQATGFSPIKKNMGDAYKGASTDSLSKACSFIGIGNEVFKGNVNLSTVAEKATVQNKTNSKPKAQPDTGTIRQYPATAYDICKECDGWLIKSKYGPTLYCRNSKNNKNCEKNVPLSQGQVAIPADIQYGADPINKAKAWLTQSGDIPF